MADSSSSIKLKELLARHSELEQSETKAQAALVTILCLTQITELKLLLDIGRQGHRFYDFVLTLLVACISLEIFVGVVIIYIGNLHYYRSATSVDEDNSSGKSASRRGLLRSLFCDCCRSCRLPGGKGAKHAGPYQSVHEMTASSSGQTAQSSATGARRPLTILDLDERGAAGPTAGSDHAAEPYVDLERADAAIELARVKSADAEVRIVRAAGYVRVVEDALRKTAAGRNADLETELARARDDLAAAQREKAESEAEQRLAEAQRHRAVFVKERRDELQERATFRKVSFWQHGATYLLYFVMLMNVFITTFGITAGPVVVMPPPATRGSVHAVDLEPDRQSVVTSPAVHTLVQPNISDMMFA